MSNIKSHSQPGENGPTPSGGSICDDEIPTWSMLLYGFRSNPVSTIYPDRLLDFPF